MLGMHNVEPYAIKGYQHEYLLRQNKPGGGVSIFIKDNITYKSRNDLNFSCDDYEFLWVEIDKTSINSKSNLVIGTIYRRPGSNPVEFNNKLSEILHLIKFENKDCIHTGDYNLDLLKHDVHAPTNDFINLNMANSFIPQIVKPTRITPITATIIDNFFSNKLEGSQSGIIISDITIQFFLSMMKSNTIAKTSRF